METAISYQSPKLSVVNRVTTWPLLFLAALPVAGHLLGGGIWHWLTLMVFGLICLIDPFVGPDMINHPDAMERDLENSYYYRFMLWLLIPIQFAVTLFGMYVFTQTPLTLWEGVGFALSMALATGFGATAAHELCHHHQRFDQFMGVLLFLPISMTNFWIYHNYGHHNKVATPEDPATAKYGDTVWVHAPRSIWKKFWLAWEVEAQGLQRMGLAFFHWRNRMIWLTALEIGWVIAMVVVFGWLAAPLLLAMWAFPRLLLGAADYLEHYGLGRRKLADGTYEPVRPVHAWDDSYLVSSLFFCQIDRHSDHHTNPSRPYQILRVMDDAPRLPYGYLTMLFVTLVPALWRKMIHPIVEEFYAKNLVVANADPAVLPAHLRDKAYQS